MTNGSTRLVEGTAIDRAEIVIGLVGALGTDLSTVETALSNALLSVGYRSGSVRISDLIKDAYARAGKPAAEPLTKLDALMDQGDALREAINHGGAAAGLAVTAISTQRFEKSGDSNHERESFATIIRQLKHPEEVRVLRSTYGPRFVLVGAWSPREDRSKAVEKRLRQTLHPGKEQSWYVQQVSRLLARDEKDGANRRLGQRVRDTFELADAYLAVRSGVDISGAATRLVHLLFGKHYETPTATEQAMFQAWGARLRSSDAGRQVGAVVIDDQGELVLSGSNEVPKPGGGQYWTGDEPDHRDFTEGSDVNEQQKIAIVTDVLQALQREPGWLAPDRQAKDVEELAAEAINGGPLADTRIGDLLEFGRVTHAEMAAICTAARRGVSIRNMTMMSTTYPCHECARVIIASGISRVVYIDPYPKSQVPEMYRHEIVDGPTQSREAVVFEPFEGVAPRLYSRVFAKADRSRDAMGEYGTWSPTAAPPRLVAEAEATYPMSYMEDGVMSRLDDALKQAGWAEADIPSVDGIAEAVVRAVDGADPTAE
ncbi:anti-phage dCTP deaminase [Actinomycetospora aeridis]|uniref:Anti-phage dCTP deaminase n=1 Tax=Actinomycetospora aeridis TaxID=3129231 RepID=A0ABU8NAG4_9PSEU